MKELTLNEYQKLAMGTCMLSCENISYMLLNLVGEVGEFAGKVAKDIRKENVSIGGDLENQNRLIPNMSFVGWLDRQEEYQKEAGDILWQLSGLCHIMGWSLDDVARQNLEKLAARKNAGTIVGNGDGIIREK